MEVRQAGAAKRVATHRRKILAGQLGHNYPVRLVLVGDLENAKRPASEAQRYGLIVTSVMDDSSSDNQIEGTLKQLSGMEHAA